MAAATGCSSGSPTAPLMAQFACDFIAGHIINPPNANAPVASYVPVTYTPQPLSAVTPLNYGSTTTNTSAGAAGNNGALLSYGGNSGTTNTATVTGGKMSSFSSLIQSILGLSQGLPSAGAPLNTTGIVESYGQNLTQQFNNQVTTGYNFVGSNLAAVSNTVMPVYNQLIQDNYALGQSYAAAQMVAAQNSGQSSKGL